MKQIAEMAVSAKYHGFFAIIYSGPSFWKTGDWAVLSDNRQSRDSISFDDIVDYLKLNVNYTGYLWISLDSPCSGKWL